MNKKSKVGFNKLNPGAQRDIRRSKAREDDVKDLMRRRGILGSILDSDRFDWNRRYDLKYILNYARNHNIKASRFTKAISTLDTIEKRIESQRKEKKK